MNSSGNFQVPQRPNVNMIHNGPTSCQRKPSQSIVIKNVLLYPMNSSDVTYSLTNVSIVIENGIVTCINSNCADPPGSDIYQISGGSIYDFPLFFIVLIKILKNEVAIPGIVSVGSKLGQYEVNAEPESHDGTADVTTSAAFSIRASDGIRLKDFQGRSEKFFSFIFFNFI